MSRDYERESDILKIISSVDITPTMYLNATQKYQAIANFLSEYGIDADMYPQGSFAFGTVVRPVNKDNYDNDVFYDLDFICQVNASRASVAPSNLRETIQDALESNERYGERLTIYDECFTIEYADVNNTGFKIDVIPAVDESEQIKVKLSKESKRPDLISASIAIPKHNSENCYTWITNNPKGFKKWFDEINAPFLEESNHQYKQRLFDENRAIFSSIEDIPDGLERSPVQRVIQIMKFHRDNYFANLPNGEELQPISAIINVLVAQISSAYDNKGASVIELLDFVLNELGVYAKRPIISDDIFVTRYGDKNAITYRDGKWIIQNPANPEDNLADSWNENDDAPKAFFRWITVIREDLIDSLCLSDVQFRSKIENAFGSDSVQNNWGTKYNSISPKPIDNVSPAKPYGANGIC